MEFEKLTSIAERFLKPHLLKAYPALVIVSFEDVIIFDSLRFLTLNLVFNTIIIIDYKS